MIPQHCVRLAITEVKQHSQMLVTGWVTKILLCQVLRASLLFVSVLIVYKNKINKFCIHFGIA
jgi:hypothetical protein